MRRLALAIVDTANATAEVRKRIERVAAEAAEHPEPLAPSGEQQFRPGLLPSTRQAIQVAVAAALAIVVGEAISPSHWYWAVIAAFVIFVGTNSWAETLDKGWQRLLGTVLGVPSGVLVATLVSGNTIASLVMIFVCIFCAFYFMKVTYSLMTFWISTMLALMYGLLGEFTFGLLLLRIEETAVGRGHRHRGRRAGIADQHPGEDSRRRPHVLPDTVRSRRGVGHQPAGYSRTREVDRDGPSTRPRPGCRCGSPPGR